MIPALNVEGFERPGPGRRRRPGELFNTALDPGRTPWPCGRPDPPAGNLAFGMRAYRLHRGKVSAGTPAPRDATATRDLDPPQGREQPSGVVEPVVRASSSARGPSALEVSSTARSHRGRAIPSHRPASWPARRAEFIGGLRNARNALARFIRRQSAGGTSNAELQVADQLIADVASGGLAAAARTPVRRGRLEGEQPRPDPRSIGRLSGYGPTARHTVRATAGPWSRPRPSRRRTRRAKRPPPAAGTAEIPHTRPNSPLDRPKPR